MTTFSRLQQQFNKLVERLIHFSGLDEDLVMNVVHYVKCLVDPDTDKISSLVFTAEMCKTFQMSDPFIIERLFSITKDENATCATVEQYCRTLCVFLSKDVELQTSFVFRVYDVDGDDDISRKEVTRLLGTCVINEVDESDPSENLREIVDFVIKNVDIDKSGSINLEEYRELVKKDVLLLEFLGKCLPNEQCTENFRSVLQAVNSNLIRKIFLNQRAELLGEPSTPTDASKRLYPVVLEMP